MSCLFVVLLMIYNEARVVQLVPLRCDNITRQDSHYSALRQTTTEVTFCLKVLQDRELNTSDSDNTVSPATRFMFSPTNSEDLVNLSFLCKKSVSSRCCCGLLVLLKLVLCVFLVFSAVHVST